MKKQTKTIIWSVAAILLFVGVYLFSQYASSENAFNFCVYSNNGDKLCFVPQSQSNDLSVVAVNSAGKSSVAPNEVTYVKIYTELPRTLVPPIYTAQVLLKDSSGKVLNIWDVKSSISQQANIAACLSGFGTCAGVSVTGAPGQIMTFNAPSTAGTYKIEYVLKDSLDRTGSVLVDESTNVIVISPTATSCPANTCQSWTTTQTITNGVYQQRSCIVFDSSCSGKTNYEYRTSCDSGFNFGTTTNSQGSGYGTCKAQPVVEQPQSDQQPQTPVDTSVPSNDVVDTSSPQGGGGSCAQSETVTKWYVDNIDPSKCSSTVSCPDAFLVTGTTKYFDTQTLCESNIVPQHNAFVQFFIDLWQSIIGFFTVN